MIVLLSPAKRLNEQPTQSELENQINSTKTLFQDKTQKLLFELEKLNALDLMEMMNVSESIASLNQNRYQSFATLLEKKAIFMFQGDSYRSLDAPSLDVSALEFAQKHLLILSGFYGVIRPLDAIKPYRLEMGITLPFGVNGSNSLPKFWKNSINQYLIEVLKKEKTIINLASAEYSQVLDKNLAKIDIVFKQNRKGVYKTFGILAKKARGLMARYIMQNKLKEPNVLKKFDWDGYHFQPEASTKQSLVFYQD